MQWEYCILDLSPIYDQRTKKSETVTRLIYGGSEHVTLLPGNQLPIAHVSHLGQQGWELVSVTATPMLLDEGLQSEHIAYYMKRQIIQ